VRGWAQTLIFGAVAVTAPRLVALFAAVDGKPVEHELRSSLVASAAVLTAMVLTGGQIYLARHMARYEARRALVAVVWVWTLAAATILQAVEICRTLSGTEVAKIMTSQWWEEGRGLLVLFALLVAASPEVLAAGAAVALAESTTAEQQLRASAEELAETERRLESVAVERNELSGQVKRLTDEVAKLRGKSQVGGQVEGQVGVGRAEVLPGSQEVGRRAGKRTGRRQVEAIPCRYGCGWTTEASNAKDPKRAESGHLATCEKRPDKENDK
jgi:hypothetical protein